MRLIDANAWESFYKQQTQGLTEYDHYCDGYGDAFDHVDDWFDAQPTVDAVELPCKMGNLVWGIKRWNRGQKAIQGVVYQMYFGEDMRLCICVKNVCRGEWGRNVFATKEETEAAIRGRKDNERKAD